VLVVLVILKIYGKLLSLSFSLNEKETKNQVKNMRHAPLGILRFLRSAKATLKS
jgi:hypothetical protein